MQTLFRGSLFNVFSRLIVTGGGGGNRTRVRESSAQDVYMLISSFCVSSGEAPSKEVLTRPTRLLFRLASNRYGSLAIPLIVASSAPAGERQRDASLTRLERTRSYWRVFIDTGGLTSHRSARHATLTSTIPVETRAPPFGYQARSRATTLKTTIATFSFSSSWKDTAVRTTVVDTLPAFPSRGAGPSSSWPRACRRFSCPSQAPVPLLPYHS